jgi:hypothetical protein
MVGEKEEEIMFRRKTKKEEEPLEIGNLLLVIISMASGGQGVVVGESYLHLAVYRILGDKSFKRLDRKYPFTLDEGRPVSKELHAAIEAISYNAASPAPRPDNFSPTIIADLERIDYERIKAAEAWMTKHLGVEAIPMNFTLTPAGVDIAAYTWANMMNAQQREVVREVMASLFS